jgi:hypothetical protein
MNLQENIRRILREEYTLPNLIRRRFNEEELYKLVSNVERTFETHRISQQHREDVIDAEVDDFIMNSVYYGEFEDFGDEIYQDIYNQYREPLVDYIKSKLDVNLQESIRKVLREETNSDDIKSRQEEAAELIKRYGHFSSPDLRYITRPLYSYIEYENFGRLKELGVKYRFTPISEINLNGALSRFIKERGVFNGIGGNIIRLYNDEPVTKSDISRIKRKIQDIINEFNTKLRTNYQIDGVVGDKSSDTLRNQLNQKLTDGEYSIEPTYNNIGIKISRGFEDEYLAIIPMDEIDKPQMLD